MVKGTRGDVYHIFNRIIAENSFDVFVSELQTVFLSFCKTADLLSTFSPFTVTMSFKDNIVYFA